MIGPPDGSHRRIGGRVPSGHRPAAPGTVGSTLGGCVSSDRPAKFFVNNGLVSNPADIYHLLRPLHRQTVAYRYLRGDRVVAHGTGWVERIVADRPDVSSFFTPLSICLSVASWEHLEFETRPDQLISYVLVQGDERVVLRFVPPDVAAGDEVGPGAVPIHRPRLHADGARDDGPSGGPRSRERRAGRAGRTVERRRGRLGAEPV